MRRFVSKGTASMTNSEASDGSFLQIFAAVDNATLYRTKIPTMGTGVSRSKQCTTMKGCENIRGLERYGMPEYLNPSGEEVEI